MLDSTLINKSNNACIKHIKKRLHARKHFISFRKPLLLYLYRRYIPIFLIVLYYNKR